MIHKLLAGKGKMKRGLSLLLCLALLGSSVISANVTAEAESDVTTVETVETSETEEETISEAVVVNEESTSQEAVSDTTETTEETGADVTETPAENMTEEVADEVAETTEDGSAETTTEQAVEETTSAGESMEAVSATDTESTSAVATVAEETVYTGTVTMNSSTLVTVEASAEAGTFPENTTMSVTLLDAGDEDVENALDESGVEYDGYVSLDISFFDANGTEVEPEDGSVSVKISMDASLLGDDVDTSSLEVHHLTETSDGLEVETVADTANVVGGTVEAADDGTVAAEFTVESFSTFTITYNNNTSEEYKIGVALYDTDGNPIDIEGIDENTVISVNNTNWSAISSIASNIISTVEAEGYSYSAAHLGSINGTTFTYLKYSTDNWNGGWRYSNSNKNNENGTSVNGQTIYLVFSKVEQLTTVDTVDSQALGITIRMIDYTSAANGITIGGSYNSYGSITQRLLQSTLGSDGYPVTSAGTSLASLFSGSSAVDANHLFILSTYEETGYLEYSSFENYAYLEEDGDFTVYEQIGTPSNTVASYYQRGNFLPYNRIVAGAFSTNTNLYDEDGNALSTTADRYGEQLYLAQGTINYYFGMYLEANFYQPEGGLVNGENMIYEFNGDDDLWVYIDDVLVLDIGGIHDAHSGYINFATGEVHVEKGDETTQDTTIKAIYEELGIFPDGSAWDESKVDEYFSGNTFADYTAHTIKMFYMERGAGASNLHMKFNLPVVKSGEIQIEKELSNTDKEKYADVKFAFQVYLQEVDSTDDNGVQTYKDSYVTLQQAMINESGIKITDSNGNTVSLDENGYFYLKPGETVTISGLQANRLYYVTEVGVSSDYYDKVLVNSTSVYDYDTDGLVAGETVNAVSTEAQVSKRPIVKFTNNCSDANSNELWITKAMASGQSPYAETDTFSFKIQLENQNGELEDYVGEYYLIDADGNYYYYSGGSLTSNGTNAVVCGTLTSEDNGVVTGVPVGYSVVITQILAGTSFSVTEVDPNATNEYTDVYSSVYGKSITDYTAQAEIETDDQVANADGEIAYGLNAKVTITNSLKEGTLTISKIVAGNMGDTTKEFVFTLTVTDGDGNPYTGYISGLKSTESEPDQYNIVDGVCNFSLKHGENIVFTLTSGYTYTVAEADYKTSDGYTSITVSEDGGDAAEKLSSSGTISGNKTVEFTNTKTIRPDTGIDLDFVPYILMLAGVAVLGGVVLFRRRRKLL